MVRTWVIAVAVSACTTAPPPPLPSESIPAATPPTADVTPPPTATPTRVQNPTQLLDYIPTTLAGEPVTARTATSSTSATGHWQVDGREVHVEMSRIDDAAQTRAGFELLGKPVKARMNGQDLRGLRVQGNPAELSRDLAAPHRASLVVVAANTYLVTLTVSPSTDLDEPLPFADYLDIGGLTRLAIVEHKALEAKKKAE